LVTEYHQIWYIALSIKAQQCGIQIGWTLHLACECTLPSKVMRVKIVIK